MNTYLARYEHQCSAHTSTPSPRMRHLTKKTRHPEQYTFFECQSYHVRATQVLTQSCFMDVQRKPIGYLSALSVPSAFFGSNCRLHYSSSFLQRTSSHDGVRAILRFAKTQLRRFVAHPDVISQLRNKSVFQRNRSIPLKAQNILFRIVGNGALHILLNLLGDVTMFVMTVDRYVCRAFWFGIY
jgi:hypothetical protein